MHLLFLFDEQRRHDCRKEGDEGDTDDDDDAAHDAPPPRVWDDVAVANRGERNDGPPHCRAVVWEVLLVDDRDDKASQERNGKRAQGEEREDSSANNGTLRRVRMNGFLVFVTLGVCWSARMLL